MASDASTESESEGGDSDELAAENVYDILADRRRRYAIHYLKQVENPIEVRELAEQVAAWENDKPIDALDSQERKRVYISLYQSHLPTLDDQGLVEYDDDRGTVELLDRVANADIYLEVVPGESIPWSYFYLGLSAAGAALLGVAWWDPGIVSEIPDLAIAGVVVAAFLVSAIAQTIHSGRMRLGDEGPPPELREE